MKKFLALSLSDVVFIMLINVKMPTTVGILTCMSRINFVLSCVEHEKSFMTSGPGLIWIQSVCRDCQQTTIVGKELKVKNKSIIGPNKQLF